MLLLKGADEQIGFLKHERSQSKLFVITFLVNAKLPSTELLIFSNGCGFPQGCLGEHNK